MQCPSCQNTDSRVLESRAADAGRSVRRRRECLNCDFRFTTYERVETVPISVIKKNGNREIFNRNKLMEGLTRACEKTTINTNKLQILVEELEVKIQQRSNREISSSEIGRMVLEELRSLSEVAFVRFASVHKQFRGISDFVNALESINTREERLASVS
ncbi:transcriptional regulator NrdR [Prochlorococcus sp. MIT 1341]|uniref:transcriptional regulator NrdR n=1 Tax=Prochlorococcus sp. MIT 1341 TaxID=3096221 RepID=UPI002A74AEC9|nr:transcriptional regulator NrdR [Prochlorococcus sp. MIT 1341]